MLPGFCSLLFPFSFLITARRFSALPPSRLGRPPRSTLTTPQPTVSACLTGPPPSSSPSPFPRLCSALHMLCSLSLCLSVCLSFRLSAHASRHSSLSIVLAGAASPGRLRASPGQPGPSSSLPIGPSHLASCALLTDSTFFSLFFPVRVSFPLLGFLTQYRALPSLVWPLSLCLVSTCSFLFPIACLRTAGSRRPPPHCPCRFLSLPVASAAVTSALHRPQPCRFQTLGAHTSTACDLALLPPGQPTAPRRRYCVLEHLPQV